MLELTDDAVARSLPPCDIFIGLSSMSVKSAKVAREKFGAKIVIDRGARHVLSQNDILSKGQANPLSQLYVDRELASYEQADYISLPSEHAVESFVEKGFDRSRLFKNLYGVDLNRFKPTPKPYGAIKLLFVGGWSLQKGVDVLSNAVAQLQNVTLTHVGQRIDAEFPRLPNFTSLGYADHARLRDVFASHHILVLPSRQDGFGMVLTEALASGLAVIGSRMTGAQDLKQMLKKPQFVGLTEPGDVNGLATAIEEMARVISSEPASREILTEADKFGLSWTAYAKRYDDFITSIC
jgi:glycosyltransferase involved in cell wall biosynthesis